MLRPLVILLLVLNLGFFAWNQGWVDGVIGPSAGAGHEPERLKRQVAPDSIKVASGSLPVRVAATQPTLCLESPLLTNDEALRAATAALERAGVAPGTYADQRNDVAGVWGVATIRMPNRDFQTRKEATLKRLHIAFEPLTGFPDEDPSLLISRHASEAAAQKALNELSMHLIKGLRVLQLSAPGSTHRLRIEQADAQLQDKLAKLKDPALGTGFARCAAPASAPSAGEAGSAASR